MKPSTSIRARTEYTTLPVIVTMTGAPISPSVSPNEMQDPKNQNYP